jgi:hypothetical protein
MAARNLGETVRFSSYPEIVFFSDETEDGADEWSSCLAIRDRVAGMRGWASAPGGASEACLRW